MGGWRRGAPVAALLLLTACERPAERAARAAAVPAAAPPAEPHAPMMGRLRQSLVGRARFDSETVAAVRSLTPCRTAFVTTRGAVAIDWAQVGRLPSRIAGDAQVTELATGGAVHVLAVPSTPPADADGVRGSLGLLAETCGADVAGRRGRR